MSFDQPITGSRGPELLRYWKASKRLSQGTLMCFWWEPPQAQQAQQGGPAAAAAPQPRLVVGVVAERDPEKLATARPQIGVR